MCGGGGGGAKEFCSLDTSIGSEVGDLGREERGLDCKRA